MNVTVPFNGRQYHILYVGIHGGSGMGASEAYNGRYYLVSPDLWKKEKDNYCMVHDSVLPRAWAYYEKNGVFLLEENDYPGRITNGVLLTILSSLDSEILDLYA